MDDDYILGFCWGVVIKEATEKDFKAVDLLTEAKWEILIPSISQSIRTDPIVLGPKLKKAIEQKTDLFRSGYLDGKKYDWLLAREAEEKLKKRKRALLETKGGTREKNIFATLDRLKIK